MDNLQKRKTFDGKTLSAIILTAIVVFLLTFLILNYIPDNKRQSELNSYKKDMFDSFACQYQCPLKEQLFQNKTQLLPDVSCTQQCTTALKNKQNESDKFSNNDLKNDNLFLDVEKLVSECRTSSVNNSTMIPSINNTLFFDCVKGKIEPLRSQYKYLS